jgi:hypothetical protein
MKLIYEDKNQIAYELDNRRISLMTNGHRVLVTDVRLANGQLYDVHDYWLSITDAIDCLKSDFGGQAGEPGVQFLRRLRKRHARQTFTRALIVFWKLIAHTLIAVAIGFAAGYIVRGAL